MIGKISHGRCGCNAGTVTGQTRSRADVLAIMRRLGMYESLDEAKRVLPDPVDLDRDADVLLGLGLSVDRLVDRLGGDAW